MCGFDGSSSASTATYYNGDNSDSTADSAAIAAARILMSLSSSSSSSNYSSFPGILPQAGWGRTRKRSNYRALPITSDIEKELMITFESLQSVMCLDKALEMLKVRYKWSKEIVAGIESIEFFLSQGLDGNQMKEILDSIRNNGGKKRKIDVESDQQKSNDCTVELQQQQKEEIVDVIRNNVEPDQQKKTTDCNVELQQQQQKKDLELVLLTGENKKPPIMKKKKKKQDTDVKMKKILELTGEDEFKGSTSAGDYQCKECKQVFKSSQALGGHTASHNRKKKTEEAAIQTRSSALEIPELGNGGGEGSNLFADGNRGGEVNCVHKCGLCSKSFPTGQALGGHKTHHRKIVGVQDEACSSEQATKFQFDFDLNASPEDEEFGPVR